MLNLEADASISNHLAFLFSNDLENKKNLEWNLIIRIIVNNRGFCVNTEIHFHVNMKNEATSESDSRLLLHTTLKFSEP